MRACRVPWGRGSAPIGAMRSFPIGHNSARSAWHAIVCLGWHLGSIVRGKRGARVVPELPLCKFLETLSCAAGSFGHFDPTVRLRVPARSQGLEGLLTFDAQAAKVECEVQHFQIGWNCGGQCLHSTHADWASSQHKHQPLCSFQHQRLSKHPCPRLSDAPAPQAKGQARERSWQRRRQHGHTIVTYVSSSQVQAEIVQFPRQRLRQHLHISQCEWPTNEAQSQNKELV
mmetsp:Transcript_70915/g.178795  ORF Transcript_70915/g.178795 Transcript_70915/m.178795 type:complete len:229 (+) Transcript_70915:197-883(+)